MDYKTTAQEMMGRELAINSGIMCPTSRVPAPTYFSSKLKAARGLKLIGYIRAEDGKYRELPKDFARSLRVSYLNRQEGLYCSVGAWVYANNKGAKQ